MRQWDEDYRSGAVRRVFHLSDEARSTFAERVAAALGAVVPVTGSTS